MPLDLVVIDHVQLLDDAEYDIGDDRMASVVRKLKILARRLDLPVIGVSRSGRTSEEYNGGLPRFSHTSDQGLEEYTDKLLLLRKRSASLSGNSEVVDVVIAKNLNGVVGDIFSLQFTADCVAFHR